MVKKLVRSRVAWVGLAVTVIYFILAFTVPRLYLFSALNGMYMGVMVSVVITFWPLFWRSSRQFPFDRTAHLSMGIGLVWISLTLSRALSMYNRFAYPEAAIYSRILNNPVTGYVGVLAIMGGILHVTGAGMDADGHWIRGRKLLLVSMLIGLIVAVAAVAFQLQGEDAL